MTLEEIKQKCVPYADLCGADLRGADLRWANLSEADLRWADLRWANLSEADLCEANLSGADLYGANLSEADLRGADLRWANLSEADLRWANLRKANLFEANLYEADLREADLNRANLRGAILSTGENWETYLKEVVPALLTGGGKTIASIVKAGGWECHDWTNCPMYLAYGCKADTEGPYLLRPRIKQFVQLFDAGLIPKPEVPNAK